MFLFEGKLPDFHPREGKCLECFRCSSRCNMILVYPTVSLGLQNADPVEALATG